MKALLTLFMVISSFYYVFNTSLKNLFEISENSVQKDSTEEANIYIKGLNLYDKGSLLQTREIIEKFGYSCEISDDINTSYRGTLCSDLQQELGDVLGFNYDDSEPITIYVTNTELVDQNVRVSGLCYGNSIYIHNTTLIKETVIHELLHSLGLGHCENRCVMSTRSSGGWDYNNDKPIFCDDCKSKAPSQFLN